MSGTNWAGNYRYQATKLHRPATLEQLQQVVAAAPRIRVLGSRHSFTDLPDSAELVSLEGLPTGVAVDRAELQSEYLLPRRHAIAAIQAVHALAELVRPVLQVSELRTVAADRLWMSPQHEQDTIAIPSPGTRADRRPAGARGAGGRVRPVPGATSLGKVFVADATAIAPLYERLPRLPTPGRPARPSGRVPQPLALQPRSRAPMTAPEEWQVRSARERQRRWRRLQARITRYQVAKLAACRDDSATPMRDRER